MMMLNGSVFRDIFIQMQDNYRDLHHHSFLSTNLATYSRKGANTVGILIALPVHEHEHLLCFFFS